MEQRFSLKRVSPSFDDCGLVTHWPRGCRPPEQRKDTGTGDVLKLVVVCLAVVTLVLVTACLVWVAR
jgi:hypothetical protein